MVMPAATAPASSWRLSAGPMMRQVQGADFKVGSAASSSVFPTPYGQGFYNLPSSVGDDAAYANRQYDDGYVNTDAGTVNDGNTSYWGYDSAGQYNASNNTLTMSVSAAGQLAGSARDISQSTLQTGAVGVSGSDENEFGFRIELDRLTDHGNGWSTGPVIGFSIFKGSSSINGVSAFSGNIHVEDYGVGVTDTYQLDPSLVGSLDPNDVHQNDGSVAGPLIPNQPDNRQTDEVLVDEYDVSLYSPVDLELEFYVITLDLGYRAERTWGDWFVNGSAGGALNIVPWDASHSERALQSFDNGAISSYSSASFDNDDLEFLFGLYAQAGLGYSFTDTISLSGFARYDWSQSFDGDVGPSSFEQDISGWSVGLLLAKEF